VLVLFEIGSCFIPGPSWTIIFLFVLPHVAGMTSMSHQSLALVEMGRHELFCLAWPQTAILQISTSWVARLTGVSHCTLLDTQFFFFIKSNAC
jgi:hypothetical protein